MLFFRGCSRGVYLLEDAPSGVVASPGLIEASLRKSGSSRSMFALGFIEPVEDEEGCVGAMGD